MKPAAAEGKTDLDFRTIEQEFDTLVVALANKIEREWPANLAGIAGARELFLILVKATNITYRTVRWICAEKPTDPFRKLEYVISVPPLNRVILDTIFTTVFLLEDLPNRSAWYYKAGWAQQKLDLIRYKAEYGHSDEWKPWLKEMDEYVTKSESILGITPGEAAKPGQIDWWPNPGKMPNYGMKAGVPLPVSRQFLKYLNDWFYRDLSSQAHLGGAGLVKRAGFLVIDHTQDPDTETRLLKKMRSDHVFETLILTLALVSELEVFLKFGLSSRAKYLWTILAAHSGVAKELYDKRYALVFV